MYTSCVCVQAYADRLLVENNERTHRLSEAAEVAAKLKALEEGEATIVNGVIELKKSSWVPPAVLTRVSSRAEEVVVVDTITRAETATEEVEEAPKCPPKEEAEGGTTEVVTDKFVEGKEVLEEGKMGKDSKDSGVDETVSEVEKEVEHEEKNEGDEQTAYDGEEKNESKEDEFLEAEDADVEGDDEEEQPATPVVQRRLRLAKLEEIARAREAERTGDTHSSSSSSSSFDSETLNTRGDNGSSNSSDSSGGGGASLLDKVARVEHEVSAKLRVILEQEPPPSSSQSSAGTEGSKGSKKLVHKSAAATSEDLNLENEEPHGFHEVDTSSAHVDEGAMDNSIESAFDEEEDNNVEPPMREAPDLPTSTRLASALKEALPLMKEEEDADASAAASAAPQKHHERPPRVHVRGFTRVQLRFSPLPPLPEAAVETTIANDDDDGASINNDNAITTSSPEASSTAEATTAISVAASDESPDSKNASEPTHLPGFTRLQIKPSPNIKKSTTKSPYLELLAKYTTVEKAPERTESSASTPSDRADSSPDNDDDAPAAAADAEVVSAMATPTKASNLEGAAAGVSPASSFDFSVNSTPNASRFELSGRLTPRGKWYDDEEAETCEDVAAVELNEDEVDDLDFELDVLAGKCESYRTNDSTASVVDASSSSSSSRTSSPSTVIGAEELKVFGPRVAARFMDLDAWLADIAERSALERSEMKATLEQKSAPVVASFLNASEVEAQARALVPQMLANYEKHARRNAGRKMYDLMRKHRKPLTPRVPNVPPKPNSYEDIVKAPQDAAKSFKGGSYGYGASGHSPYRSDSSNTTLSKRTPTGSRASQLKAPASAPAKTSKTSRGNVLTPTNHSSANTTPKNSSTPSRGTNSEAKKAPRSAPAASSRVSSTTKKGKKPLVPSERDTAFTYLN